MVKIRGLTLSVYNELKKLLKEVVDDNDYKTQVIDLDDTVVVDIELPTNAVLLSNDDFSFISFSIYNRSNYISFDIMRNDYEYIEIK